MSRKTTAKSARHWSGRRLSGSSPSWGIQCPWPQRQSSVLPPPRGPGRSSPKTGPTGGSQGLKPGGGGPGTGMAGEAAAGKRRSFHGKPRSTFPRPPPRIISDSRSMRGRQVFEGGRRERRKGGQGRARGRRSGPDSLSLSTAGISRIGELRRVAAVSGSRCRPPDSVPISRLMALETAILVPLSTVFSPDCP